MIPAIKAALLFSIMLFPGGCSHLQETAKVIWGSSIAHLEEARADGRVVIVQEDRQKAFAQAAQALKNSGAKIYLEDKNGDHLAAMGFKGYVDTTQVGLFFTSLEEGGDTKIEVASMSPPLARDVEEILLSYFKKGAGDERQ